MKTITIQKPNNYSYKDDFDKLLNIFIEELRTNICDAKYIITNGNIIDVITRHPEFKCDRYEYNERMNKMNNIIPFYIGEIFDMELILNPYTPWNDNRIVLKNDYISDDYINNYYTTNMIDVIIMVDDEYAILS